jgi:polyisoprenoid-binding protein YceI
MGAPRAVLRSLLGACMVVGFGAGLSAQVFRDAPLTKGTLAFDGHATLGDFTGTTSTVKGAMTGAATLAGVRGWVEAPTKTLVTGNGKRDRDMYGSLEVEKFPIMRFDLDRVESGELHGDSTAVTLHGRFTIHGVSRESAVAGWLWDRDKVVRFRGSVPIDARDFGIGGLSKMLGVLKMNPKLLVRMEVEFTP